MLAVAVGFLFEAMAWRMLVSLNGSVDFHYLTWVLFVSIAFFTILMIPGISKILSTELSEDGIQQLAFFSDGRLWSKKRLGWRQINKASFLPKRGAYRVYGPSFSIIVSVNFFNDATETINFMQEHLPEDVSAMMV